MPLGRTVTNPVNGEQIPMCVADYVLMEYGTGAIMAVPAHDERDYEFAREVRCSRSAAWSTAGELPCTGDGPLVNSGRFDGMHNREAYEAIVDWLEAEGKGKRAVNYRLRDWLLSRQRYWGCPIPIVYCERGGHRAGAGRPAAGRAARGRGLRAQGHVAAGGGGGLGRRPPARSAAAPARRETDTMDTFVDSSWYFLRYCDPHNDQAPWDREVVDSWMPVDQYIGGVEHAILHLLYARFFVKALADLDLLERAGAVRAPLHPGDDHPRRREDVQVEGQRRLARGPGRALRRRHRPLLHPASSARRARTPTGRTRAWAACTASSSRLWTVAARGGRTGAAERRSRRRPRARRCVRKAHWAIDKVTRDMRAGSPSTRRSRR